MITHITRVGGGFTSTVVIENTAPEPQTLTLQPYSDDGTQLESISVELDAGGVFRQNAQDLLGESVSHFLINGSEEAKVNLFYDFSDGSSSPAFVGESNEEGSIWRLFTGNWDTVWDGIAVVNLGTEATDVWITQKNDQNEIVSAKKVASNLAPNGKALYVIGSANDRPFESSDGFFEVSANQSLSMTSLQGTLLNDTLNVLYTSESRPVSTATSKRDDRGVWFIEQGDLYDVHEMMGYNVAVDRMWQMDVFRRQGRGTLGEMLSITQIPNVAELDSLYRSRSYGLDELDALFNALDRDSKTMILAYVDGVNRRIAQLNSDPELMPLEYELVNNDRVIPFTHYDLMAHIANFQFGFSVRSYGTEQIMNAAMLQELESQFGAEEAAKMFNDLRYTSDPESQSMIAGPLEKMDQKQAERLAFSRNDLDIRADARAFTERIHRIIETEKAYGMHIKGGSYAWAVHGSKTATGNPMLYAGPQVGFAAPNLFLEGSIISDELNVSGATIPGIPAFVIGRTPHHAWSFQVGSTGSFDYYVEDDENVRVLRQETIKVRDGDDFVLDVMGSDHGPILADFGGKQLALKYSQRDFAFHLGPGLLGLARATNMDEFGAAAEKLAVSQHILYVDQDGNIAYWHAGRQPVRPDGDWRFPQGFLANQEVLEWDAAVIEPIISERNPEKGYFAGWNNKPSPDFHDESATAGFGPYHRGHVIDDWFKAYDPENKWTYEQIRDLALEIGVTGQWAAGGNPWTVLESAVTDAITNNPTTERNNALEMLQAWDGKSVAGGRDAWAGGADLADASILMDALIPRLVSQTFDDELGAGQIDLDFISRFQVFLHGVRDSGLTNYYDWFTNLSDATAPQTAEDTILTTLDGVLAELGPRPWGTSARSGINYNHILFGNIANGLITDPSPWSQRATYAHCVEYDGTGLKRMESIFALGQSGHITGTSFLPVLDPDALSMKDDFDNFVLRPFPLFP